MSKYCWHGWIWRLQMKSDKSLVGVKSFDIYSWLRVSLKQAKILNYIHFPYCVSFAWFCLSYLDKLKDKVKKWKIKLCTCCKIWLTWLTLVFLVREGLKIWIYVCLKTWLTWLTLFSIAREGLEFQTHVCLKTWLTWLILCFIVREGLKFEYTYVSKGGWLGWLRVSSYKASKI